MKRIGFIGCGKIGKKIMQHVLQRSDMEISFIQAPSFKDGESLVCPIISGQDAELYRSSDLIVECANPLAVKENYELALNNTNLLIFSLTALADQSLYKKIKEQVKKTNNKIFIPHGAIMGIDGIFDGKSIWKKVVIETIKNPQSLQRNDTKRTVLFEGTTREACMMFPRNVNVHAAVALAGIGFDKTESRIIVDPDSKENYHKIILNGVGVNSEIIMRSQSNNSITGAYTPVSACGSLNRIFSMDTMLSFV